MEAAGFKLNQSVWSRIIATSKKSLWLRREEDRWVWLHTIIHPLHHRSSLFHTDRRSACSRPVGAQVVSRRMENATQGSRRPSQARRPLWCAASWPPSPPGHPQPLPCRMTDGRFPTTTCAAAAKCQTSCTAVIRALKTETWGTLVFRLTLEKEDSLQTQTLNPHLADQHRKPCSSKKHVCCKTCKENL